MFNVLNTIVYFIIFHCSNKKTYLFDGFINSIVITYNYYFSYFILIYF